MSADEAGLEEAGLDEAIEQLYAATPENFMTVRTGLVAQAREAKNRELAKQIGALRKPTRSAWMINLLARSAADEVGGLLDLGAAMREAQEQLSGRELRRLSGERQKAVSALAKRAGSLAAENGHKATDSQLQEVVQHLQAALADPTLAEDVRAGRVTQIVTFGGFGPWEAVVPPPKPAKTAAAKKKSAGAEPVADEETPPGPTPEDIQSARDSWDKAQATVREAEAEVEAAEKKADAAAETLDRLRAELATAEEATAEAAEEKKATQERLAGRRTDAEAAERALEDLIGD